MSKYNTMGKDDLRKACKAAGIAYGKLNNDGMRAALTAKDEENDYTEGELLLANEAEADLEQNPDAPEHQAGAPAATLTQAQIDGQIESLGIDGIDGHCPFCNISLENGVSTYDDICDANREYAGQMERKFTCLGCNKEWGPRIKRTPKVETGTGLKIEKDREERNGVKRPSIGGMCRAVWDACDAYVTSNGNTPGAKDIKALADEKGWNKNNASIEYYNWRKFMGIRGRI